MEFINLIIVGQPLWMWLTFMGVVLFLLFIDLGIFHRKLHEVSIKESLWMSAFYITIALIFGAWIWNNLGAQSGKEYLTGFLIEKTLAMDNIFLISLIFTYFKVPALYQHRVLFWGILGVIVLRAIMIGIGATLIAEFSWVLYIFAVFLIITGIKMLYIGDNVPDIENNPILKFLRRRLKVTPELHQEKFFVKKLDKETGKVTQFVTPLFVCLILIEITDLIFALDSVPAIFAITTDPYIVYTSNIFAILGLRALYFALSVIIQRFKYLKVSLALILIFIGSKIFIADIIGIEKFPVNISLGVTLTLLLVGVFVSLYKTRPSKTAN